MANRVLGPLRGDPGLLLHLQRRALAQGLIERFDPHDKDIIEIGCGKGEFLMLLCELGDDRGLGFDPGVHPDRIQGPAADRVRVVQDFYSERYSD